MCDQVKQQSHRSSFRQSLVSQITLFSTTRGWRRRRRDTARGSSDEGRRGRGDEDAAAAGGATPEVAVGRMPALTVSGSPRRRQENDSVWWQWRRMFLVRSLVFYPCSAVELW